MNDRTRPPAARADHKRIIAALGVVFGDIGTSPLYAFRECFQPAHGIVVDRPNVFGLLSLIIWSLLLLISLKYVWIVLRADNRGEGGVLALSALLTSSTVNWRLWGPVSATGLIGAALFFGDGAITPAISVLSAMEGLSIAAPRLHHLVLPGAIAILTMLFMNQRRGTGAMGRLFGPVMLLWFITLATLGLRWIAVSPDVLFAIAPWHALRFLADNGFAGFAVLASVFLAVTGAEALYADMGHFGRTPIRRSWFRIVLPALVLNYLGQGALLLQDPGASANPFYGLAPTTLLGPLIILATCATVIASQAVISGVFSVTTQAINLGFLPRIQVLQSSQEEIGQVYVPLLNWLLFASTLLLLLGFRSSSALAGAYGIAVSSTMLITGVLVIMLMYNRNEPQRMFVMGMLVVGVAIEAVFFCSNMLKIDDGGWVPILFAVIAYSIMTTWDQGQRSLNWLIAKAQMPLRDFEALIARNAPHRVAGTAVYLTPDAQGMPLALLNNLRFNHVLHERNILLTFVKPEVPFVQPADRVEVQDLGSGLYRILAHYGFMERPDAILALQAAETAGIEYVPGSTVYIVGHENPEFSSTYGMPMWRRQMFAFMSRNSQFAAAHFRIPTHRLLDIGSPIRL